MYTGKLLWKITVTRPAWLQNTINQSQLNTLLLAYGYGGISVYNTVNQK